DDPLRRAQFRFVGAFGFVVADGAAQIRVNHDRRLTTRTKDFDLRLQPSHYFLPPSAPARPLNSNFLFNSIGWPSGSVATSFSDRIGIRRRSKRCPKPATNTSSGA